MGNRLLLAWLAIAMACAIAMGANESFEQELAAGPDMKLVEAAVAPIRLEGEAFSATPARVSGEQWVYIIYLNASQAAVVDVKKDMLGRWEYSLPKNVEGIAAALRLYYIDASAKDIARAHIILAHAHTLRFSQTAKEEAECRRLLGLEGKNCTDYEECLRACYSSTSFCQPIALDEGKSFIIDVWRYANLSDDVRTKYLLLEDEFLRVNASPSASGVADYRRAIAVVLSAQEEYAKHRFNGLICKTPTHNIEALASAQKELDEAMSILSPLEGRNSSAQAMVDGIAMRLEAKRLEETAKKAKAAEQAKFDDGSKGANGTDGAKIDKGAPNQINFSNIWGAIASGGSSKPEDMSYALLAPLAAGACAIILVPISAVAIMLLMKKKKGL